MTDLAGADERDSVRRGSGDDAPRGLRDGLCVPEAVLKGDEDRSIGQRTQCEHRTRGIVRLGCDEHEIRSRAARHADRSARFRNDRSLSTNSEAARFDRGNVLCPPDKRHIVTLREKSPKETSDCAGAEHEKFHELRDVGALQNGFDVRFASSRFYINRKMDDFLSLRYF